MNIVIEQGFLRISDEDRNVLASEFEVLENVEQQIEFWQNKFGLNYSMNDPDNIQTQTFTEFMIYPENRDEIEYLNNYNYRTWLKNSSLFGCDVTILKWKDAFDQEVETVVNKEEFITYELRRIDDYILDQQKSKKFFKNRNLIPIRDKFIDSYESYLKFKKEIDWGRQIYNFRILDERLKGIDCAKYREYVNSHLHKGTSKKQVELKLTGEQKFLILHYLKFGNEINANTRRAVLYESFIELAESTIRPMFSDITRYETVENLNRIIDFFRKIKHHEMTRKVQDKLDKLNKRG